MGRLTEKQIEELSHLEDNEVMTDYEAFIKRWWEDLRFEFLELEGLPMHHEINGALKKKFNIYCATDFARSFRDDRIEIYIDENTND